MLPIDDWCKAALVYHGIGTRILSMERKQENGKVAPDVRERAQGWMNMAREAQEKHEQGRWSLA